MEEDCKFELRCQLPGHKSDVQRICLIGDTIIATSSSDTIHVWKRRGQKGYGLLRKLEHQSDVGPIAFIPSSDEDHPSFLLSAGKDARIFVWRLSTFQPIKALEGHELEITGLAIDSKGILSCSVDGTIRVWDQHKQVAIMRGHTGPIQSVVTLPSRNILTCSSDKTIKIWHGSQCLKTIQAHSDIVRALAVVPNLGFVSASHDKLVKLWSFEGEHILDMVGHTHIVYSVAAHKCEEIASGSEDGTAKIWRDGMCFQTLEHPGGVSDLKFLPNGDLVTACSDGVARIWTMKSSCFALITEREAYSASVFAWKLQMKKVKLSGFQGPDLLKTTGSTDNQEVIIDEGTTAVAYFWNSSFREWQKVGEVIDEPNQQCFIGKASEHEFDVEIEPGQRKEKLGYNSAQNAYTVADNWLTNHNLPSTLYLEKIVDGISKSIGKKLDTPVLSNYIDPFTGGSSYIPKQETSNSQPAIGKDRGFKHIPKVGMVLYVTAQFDKIVQKIKEFNAALNIKARITNLGLSRIEAITGILNESTQYNSLVFSKSDFELIGTAVLSWPLANLFPVMDILRMLVLHPQAANHYALLAERRDDSLMGERGDNLLMRAFKRAVSEPVLLSNLSTCMRAIVNCFRHSSLKKWLLDNIKEILDLFSVGRKSESKVVRLAYITLILNYTVLTLEAKSQQGEPQLLSAAIDMSGSNELDMDVRFRALQVIGSLIHSGSMKAVAIDLDILSIVNAASHSQGKVAEVAADIKSLLP